MASAKLIEQCSHVDLDIQARQKQFGVDLYHLLEQQAIESDPIFSSNSSLFQIQELYAQVHDEITTYHDKLPDKNKRRRRLRVGSISNAMTDQWELQRKQKFGLACFDIVFDMLGTSSQGSLSLLSKEEKRVHELIQKAVQDVLELERVKEAMIHEDETPVEAMDDNNMLCGALVCCF
jgi:hypothetical protein